MEVCSDVSLTVHLSITLADDQLDTQIFKNTFITILYMYMFQAISCSVYLICKFQTITDILQQM